MLEMEAEKAVQWPQGNSVGNLSVLLRAQVQLSSSDFISHIISLPVTSTHAHRNKHHTDANRLHAHTHMHRHGLKHTRGSSCN